MENDDFTNLICKVRQNLASKTKGQTIKLKQSCAQISCKINMSATVLGIRGLEICAKTLTQRLQTPEHCELMGLDRLDAGSKSKNP